MSPEGPKSNGTSGTNGREMPGPKSAQGPKIKWDIQMEVKYAKEPKEPRTNQKLPRVLTGEKVK
ncbi:hypothetical protein KI387_039588, partial [Taxus chinensis]